MRVGFTFDRTDRFDAIQRFLRQCKKRPCVRLICDPPWSGFVWDQLREPCRILSQKADILLTVSDSIAFKKYSVSEYVERTRKAMAEYGRWVKWFEVGNEIGGGWLGQQDDVADKLAGAMNVARETGRGTAVTWYLAGSSPDTTAYTIKRMSVPADLQLISYYPNWAPDYTPDWEAWFGMLAMKYQRSKVGIGEFGAEPMLKTPSHRADLIRKMYKTARFASSRFFGGYFYWDTWQDVCGNKETAIFSALQSGFVDPSVTD